MRRSRNFCQVGSRPNCQKTALTMCFFVSRNLFYTFTVVYQWFISMKTIIFQGYKGGPTFSRGGGGGGGGQTFSNFPGGGRLNANLYRNP